MTVSFGNVLPLPSSEDDNESESKVLGKGEAYEEEYNEPCWNCEDAIEDFLEEGRRNQLADVPLFNMQIIRTGTVTRAELEYLVIDHKYQFSKFSQMAIAADSDASDLQVNDLVRYWLEGDRCVRVNRLNRESELHERGWDDDDAQESSKMKSRLGRDSVKLSANSDNVSIMNGKIISAQKLVRQNYPSDVQIKVEISGENEKQNVVFNLSEVDINGPVVRAGENFRSQWIPTKGDWIHLTVSKQKETEGKVIAIGPLLWKDFEGEVTRTGQRFVIVECIIYIPGDACLNGYHPRRGDWLGGLAFESAAAEGCTWRAINVYPRPFSSFKPRGTLNEVGNRPLQAENAGDPELLKHLEINGDVHFGQVLINESEPRSEIVSIANHGESSEYLSAIHMGEMGTDKASPLSAFDVVLEGKKFPIRISPNERVDFTVTCKPKQVGLENLRIYFEFKEASASISTYVEVDGVTQEMLDFTFVAASTRARSTGSAANSFRNENQVVVPGERPIFSTKPREAFIQRLGSYEIPAALRRCLALKDDVIAICPYLAEPLSFDNYIKHFDTLLHLEEFAIQDELDKYSLSCVFFAVVSSSQMALKVPGLQEQRPSLLVGDKVIATDPSPNSNCPAYEGNICEVRTDDVLILFASNFHSAYSGENYNVSFKFNRTPFRRCHQAVELAAQRLGKYVLFPQIGDVDGRFLKEAQSRVATRTHKSSGRTSTQRSAKIDPCLYVPRLELTFFTTYLNDRQRMAVLRIVEGLARPIPYILYGPPGTGKTVTLVEVLLQLYHLLPGSRILACAPSNSATDLLCLRLHELHEKTRDKDKEPHLDMVRLNAAQRKDAGMADEVIQRYSKSLDDIESAVKSRLVVATCTTAGQMYTASIKAGSFTHVVIDEAGHATEPEALIPCNFVDVRNGQIVLAGDPKQLGPILESRQSSVYGLQLSLLERLSQLPVYARDESRFSRIGEVGGYNPLVATKLVNNYRSHPALFAVSSRCFYDGELVANAPLDVQNAFVSENATSLLPNPAIPLILHSIQGQESHEGQSLSWFNCCEVIQVIEYLRKLLIDGFDGKLVSPDDIGIITPYRKQIEIIRRFMERVQVGTVVDQGEERPVYMPPVKVGTVEEFQGQERSVIILSIVRSTEAANVRQALGFLANPKRMNVALTRAKSLLIVIANPLVLTIDDYWADFVKFAVENGCCVATDDVLAKIRKRFELAK